ncbi:hypothetical protein ABQX22_09190 [Xanthomonas sp. WHRI 1810A]|uniref:hypothetical protein n=1 Tax=Xanthomonas sp. WHRI 1810A TaxID=3161565 RepID=UPI0032E8784A
MKKTLIACSLAALLGSTLVCAADAPPASNISHEQFAKVLAGDWRLAIAAEQCPGSIPPP